MRTNKANTMLRDFPDFPVLFECPSIKRQLEEKIYYYGFYSAKKAWAIASENHSLIPGCEYFLDKFNKAIISLNNGFQLVQSKEKPHNKPTLLNKNREYLKKQLTGMGYDESISESIYGDMRERPSIVQQTTLTLQPISVSTTSNPYYNHLTTPECMMYAKPGELRREHSQVGYVQPGQPRGLQTVPMHQQALYHQQHALYYQQQQQQQQQPALYYQQQQQQQQQYQQRYGAPSVLPNFGSLSVQPNLGLLPHQHEQLEQPLELKPKNRRGKGSLARRMARFNEGVAALKARVEVAGEEHQEVVGDEDEDEEDEDGVQRHESNRPGGRGKGSIARRRKENMNEHLQGLALAAEIAAKQEGASTADKEEAVKWRTIYNDWLAKNAVEEKQTSRGREYKVQSREKQQLAAERDLAAALRARVEVVGEEHQEVVGDEDKGKGKEEEEEGEGEDEQHGVPVCLEKGDWARQQGWRPRGWWRQKRRLVRAMNIAEQAADRDGATSDEKAVANAARAKYNDFIATSGECPK